MLDASNAGEALLVCEEHRGPIHLLLTDVVMPRMNGRVLAERLAPLRAEMKVIFMSGYVDSSVRQGILDAGLSFLQKPLTPSSLAGVVRRVLDGTPRD